MLPWGEAPWQAGQISLAAGLLGISWTKVQNNTTPSCETKTSWSSFELTWSSFELRRMKINL
jgi:hypothetical protein